MNDDSAATEWHAKPAVDALTAVGGRPTGLSDAEVADRLRRDGANALTTRTLEPWWHVLGRQFASVIILLLLASAALTAVLQRWIDAIAILVAVLADVSLGFTQEMRAARDVAALRRFQVGTSHVRRSGVVRAVSTESIVVGDIVVLESGARVPADLRLLTTNRLRLDESLLTGESVPVAKSPEATPESTPAAEQAGMAWGGTLVVSGRAEGVVVATGAATVMGVIDTLVRSADTPTPLQRLMRRFETKLGIFVGVVAAGVLVAGVLLGHGFGTAFLTAVSLAVAAVPEGLPIVLTVALSLGVSRMARQRAVVRTLPSVEALGSTTVIASDKTGTLTENRMTVERIWSPRDSTVVDPGVEPEFGAGCRDVLRVAALSNDAHHDPATRDLVGDPVDVAIAALALRGAALADAEFSATPNAHAPYEPERRRSTTVRDEHGIPQLLLKGAPDLVLAASTTMTGATGPVPIEADAVHAAHDALAAEGMRVLAVARRRVSSGDDPHDLFDALRDLEFVGLIGMSDPPRAGVADAIAACRRAGVTVMMLTGDHPRTAVTVGRRLGLGGTGEPVTGTELAAIDDDTLVRRLRGSRVAARVTPHDKLRIVRALEAAGEVVAVTGDGVNDAPALRAASLGVAMGRGGTDVARDAADIVLTDDDFRTIVGAVREGRITFAAVQKATFFLLSTGFAAFVAVVADLAVGGPLIFLPVQMIWFNLVSNGVQDVALAFERGDGDELDRPPRSHAAGLLSRRLWGRVVLTAASMGLVVLGAFHGALATGAPVDQARTFALTTFAFLNLFQTFNARSERRSVFRQSLATNPLLLAAAAGSLALHILAVTTPLGWTLLGFAPLTGIQWLIAIGLGVTVLGVVEADKVAARLVRRRRA
ncbi:cation-translocating P-type ATPase [Pseudolysinimonas yzui]|uniref:ATPase n=1 Tax=Pseudolysinimonas yzui TaxID=2708254 RepID=A0A8J3DSF6_9MICO|nr:HAD-IC family P-type ATPase [Pseudolysinimonas yzui]GHF04410.1 ATPase [Pseudolysinimonas yzui]